MKKFDTEQFAQNMRKATDVFRGDGDSRYQPVDFVPAAIILVALVIWRFF